MATGTGLVVPVKQGNGRYPAMAAARYKKYLFRIIFVLD